MLILPIKKKWFDMILSGEKKEEYREIKPYYDNRFYHFRTREIDKNTFSLCIESPEYALFRNGYSSNSPTIKCQIEITTGIGKPEWGAEPNKEYYILKILSVEKSSRYI